MRTIVGFILLISSLNLLAYEPITHSRMSSNALRRSTIGSSNALARFGLPNASIDDDLTRFPNSDGKSLSITELVEFGADWEDTRSASQALRHFYNPVDGSKLLPLVGETSPDWALEDRGRKDGQAYSYRLARQNFHRALTSQSKSDRDAAWGLTFQTLGHVAHHLQDMALPFDRSHL